MALSILSVGILAAWKMHSTVYQYDAISDRMSIAVSRASQSLEEEKQKGYDNVPNLFESRSFSDNRNRMYRFEYNATDANHGIAKRVVVTICWNNGNLAPVNCDQERKKVRIGTLIADIN